MDGIQMDREVVDRKMYLLKFQYCSISYIIFIEISIFRVLWISMQLLSEFDTFAHSLRVDRPRSEYDTKIRGDSCLIDGGALSAPIIGIKSCHIPPSKAPTMCGVQLSSTRIIWDRQWELISFDWWFWYGLWARIPSSRSLKPAT